MTTEAIAHYSKYVGAPYKKYGRDLESGVDCLGIAAIVCRDQGFGFLDAKGGFDRLLQGENLFHSHLPDLGWVRDDQADGEYTLLLFETKNLGLPDHCAFYVGDGLVLHSCEPKGVQIESLEACERRWGKAERWSHRKKARPPAESPLKIDGSLLPLEGNEVLVTMIPDPLRRPGHQDQFKINVDPKGVPLLVFLPLEWQKFHEDGNVVFFLDQVEQDDTSVLVGPGRVVTMLFAPAGTTFLVSFLIGLALSALSFVANLVFGPDTPKPGEDEGSGSPTFRLDGIRNTAVTGIPISVLYGEHIVAGNFISVFITVDSEGRQVLNTLRVISHGPIESINGIAYDVDELTGDNIPESSKLNGSPTREFQNVAVSHRLGNTNQSPIPGFNRAVTVANFTQTLQPSTAITHTTSKEIDGFQVIINFPRGLYHIDDGELDTYGWDGLFEWRLQGTTPWNSEAIISTQASDPWVDSTRNPTSRMFEKLGLPRGIYEIRITRTKAADSETTGSQSDLNSINEISEDQLSYPGLALIAVRAVSDEQIPGGNVPTLTDEARGRKVWTFDGNLQLAQEEVWTQNPAWICMDILSHPVYGLGRNAAISLYENFDLNWWVNEFAAFCDEQVDDGRGGMEDRCRCDFVVDTSRPAWQLVVEIMRSNFASPMLVGRVISGALQKSRSVVTVVGMGNVREFSKRKVGVQSRPNVIEASFRNAEIDYEQDLVQRVNPTIYTGAPVVKETLTVIGVTRPGQAARLVQFRVDAADSISDTVSLKMGIEGLGLLPGMVVYVAHEAIQMGTSGRIKAATSNSVTLDRTVDTTTGTYKLVARVKDSEGNDSVEVRDVTTAAEVAAGGSVGVSAWTTVPQVGAPYSLGLVERFVQAFEIIDISLEEDLSRTLSLREYDDTVFDPSPGTVGPSTDPIPDRRLIPDKASDINIREVQSLSPDGSYQAEMDVSWSYGEGAAEFEVWVARLLDGGEQSPAFKHVATVRDNFARVKTGTGWSRRKSTVVVAVVPVSPAGAKTRPTEAATQSIRLVGDVAKPPTLNAEWAACTDHVRVYQVGDHLMLHAGETDDPRVSHYVVYISGGPRRLNAFVLTKVRPGAEHILPPFAREEGVDLGVSSVTKSGIESDPIWFPDVYTKDASETTLSSHSERDAGFPGTKSDFTVSSGDLVQDESGGKVSAYEFTVTEFPENDGGMLLLTPVLTSKNPDIDADELALLRGYNVEDIASIDIQSDDLQNFEAGGPLDVLGGTKMDVEIAVNGGSYVPGTSLLVQEKVTTVTVKITAAYLVAKSLYIVQDLKLHLVKLPVAVDTGAYNYTPRATAWTLAQVVTDSRGGLGARLNPQGTLGYDSGEIPINHRDKSSTVGVSIHLFARVVDSVYTTNELELTVYLRQWSPEGQTEQPVGGMGIGYDVAIQLPTKLARGQLLRIDADIPLTEFDPVPGNKFELHIDRPEPGDNLDTDLIVYETRMDNK